MRSFRKELWFNVQTRRAFINIVKAMGAWLEAVLARLEVKSSFFRPAYMKNIIEIVDIITRV